MTRGLLTSLLLLTSITAPAIADTLGANPQDRGRVTYVERGVKEIDVGGLFVLSHSKTGDAEGQTKLSTLAGLGFQYFLKDNVSVGGAALIAYDKLDATTSATSFGGLAFAALHVRLGLGAFLRPALGLGALFGKQETEVTQGMIVSANQAAALVRIGMPFAYFPGTRVVLQAGPELDISVGSVTPDGGDGQSFINVSGGFGLNAGYVF
jgi:hypothetical protein